MRRKYIRKLAFDQVEVTRARIFTRVIEYGRSQKELAKRAGVGQATISRIMWRKEVTPETLAKVNRGLDKFEDSTHTIPLKIWNEFGNLTKAYQEIREQVNRLLQRRDELTGALSLAQGGIRERDGEIERLRAVASRLAEEVMELRDRLDPQRELPLDDNVQWGPP